MWRHITCSDIVRDMTWHHVIQLGHETGRHLTCYICCAWRDVTWYGTAGPRNLTYHHVLQLGQSEAPWHHLVQDWRLTWGDIPFFRCAIQRDVPSRAIDMAHKATSPHVVQLWRVIWHHIPFSRWATGHDNPSRAAAVQKLQVPRGVTSFHVLNTCTVTWSANVTVRHHVMCYEYGSCCDV